MNLKNLFTFHAFITLAASLVLLFLPASIPATIQIKLQKDAFILSYFLASAEIALAYLSYNARNAAAITQVLISKTFIVFHSITACVELYAYTQGTSYAILFNVLLRIMISFLFFWYGVYKSKHT